jgi:5,10-methylenetetrahydromethanopterin reductase
VGIAGTVDLMAVGPVERVVAVAADAERRGMTRCWVYDEGLVTRDVYVTLAAIALHTEHMALGTGITNPYTRHPGATAAAIATLDELSAGRAFVGVGAGGSLTLRPLALGWARPARAVEEMVAAMRRLFAGDVVDLDGETLTLRSARLGWGREDIEIWVAGRGRRIVDVGARLADGVHLSYLHKQYLPHLVERIRAAAEHRTVPVRLSYATALVTDDASFERARADLTFRIADSPAEVKRLIGITAEEEAALRSGLAAGGPPAAAQHVRPEWVGQFALVGSVADCAAELSRLADRYGFSEFQVGIHELDGADAQLERAAAVLGLT